MDQAASSERKFDGKVAIVTGNVYTFETCLILIFHQLSFARNPSKYRKYVTPTTQITKCKMRLYVSDCNESHACLKNNVTNLKITFPLCSI